MWCYAIPQGLMYQHTVADGHLLLLLQKGLHGGMGWPNLYFGGLYYTYVNNTVLWINMIQVHHFVSFVSARLFYVFGFFLSKILSKFLSVSWLRTSASSCSQVCEYECEGMLLLVLLLLLVLWFCCVPVMCVKELDETIYKQV